MGQKPTLPGMEALMLRFAKCFSIALMLLVTGSALAAESLVEQFRSPPASARPHTWWHWIDGNVTKEGITADLEAMAKAGIGGAHIFNAGTFGGNDAQGRPVNMPKGPVNYNTAEWRSLMVHAMREAKRLGLEITIHNCCGWSSSGGPWVKPDDAMKKVVWSSMTVEGPKELDAALPGPATVRDYYRDIAVFAMPQVKVPAGPEGHQAYLTGAGDNDGAPFGDLKWPVVRQREIVDVSAKRNGDRLTWAVPAGRWTVLRIGYTLTGAQNVASSDSGRGLEVDKLSAGSLDHFFDDGLLPLIREAGPLAGDSFTTVLIDSYETGRQNWTPKMAEEFQARRGYDLRPYLPALAGVAVENSETTQRFLFDYRRTIEEAWADNYSKHFADRLKEHGLKLGVEPYGNGNFNSFSYSDAATLIMGEYWVGDASVHWSVKLAASVAHVLGRPVVGAEALTAVENRAGWRNHPFEWKPFADRGYTNGINRIIYHRFTHQPWVSGVVPGMTMGPWGSHVDRTQTWWPLAASWHAYLSRCQYLLQAGQFVADVCVYTGEDAPQAEERRGVASVPLGYDFDYCGSRALLQASAKDGRLVLPSGMSYRVLALPAADFMSPAVAAKVQELIRGGVPVVGPQPRRAAGLKDIGEGDAQVVKLMGDPGASGKSLRDVLKKIELGPDFRCNEASVSAIHRRIRDVDAYFVASMSRVASEQKCFFRVEGRRPELWHPETGLIEDAPLWQSVPGGVEVPLRFGPAGSVFVVFREKAGGGDSVVGVRTTVAPEAAFVGPRVLRAEYGVLKVPALKRDVTKLATEALAAAGEVRAGNDVFGGDPAPLVVKALRLVYVDGGKEHTVTIKEGETFTLPTVQSPPPPTWELQVQAGKPTLLAWRTGKYEVRTAAGVTKKIDAAVPAAAEIAGPWEVRFPEGWDAPASVSFDKLISWTERNEFGIKYFSGTVSYVKTFNVPAEFVGSGRRLMLDLGVVREIAQVLVNGKELGVLWWPPFRLDVTDAVRPGDNQLEVRVTNLWVNRLVGDEQLPDDIGWQGITFNKWPEWLVKGTPRPEPRRKTFTTWHHNTKDTPLIPSGLMGPVMLRPVVVYPAR
jgi:hypothetical protein